VLRQRWRYRRILAINSPNVTGTLSVYATTTPSQRPWSVCTSYMCSHVILKHPSRTAKRRMWRVWRRRSGVSDVSRCVKFYEVKPRLVQLYLTATLLVDMFTSATVKPQVASRLNCMHWYAQEDTVIVLRPSHSCRFTSFDFEVTSAINSNDQCLPNCSRS